MNLWNEDFVRFANSWECKVKLGVEQQKCGCLESSPRVQGVSSWSFHLGEKVTFPLWFVLSNKQARTFLK